MKVTKRYTAPAMPWGITLRRSSPISRRAIPGVEAASVQKPTPTRSPRRTRLYKLLSRLPPIRKRFAGGLGLPEDDARGRAGWGIADRHGRIVRSPSAWLPGDHRREGLYRSRLRSFLSPPSAAPAPGRGGPGARAGRPRRARHWRRIRPARARSVVGDPATADWSRPRKRPAARRWARTAFGDAARGQGVGMAGDRLGGRPRLPRPRLRDRYRGGPGPGLGRRQGWLAGRAGLAQGQAMHQVSDLVAPRIFSAQRGELQLDQAEVAAVVRHFGQGVEAQGRVALPGVGPIRVAGREAADAGAHRHRQPQPGLGDRRPQDSMVENDVLPEELGERGFGGRKALRCQNTLGQGGVADQRSRTTCSRTIPISSITKVTMNGQPLPATLRAPASPEAAAGDVDAEMEGEPIPVEPSARQPAGAAPKSTTPPPPFRAASAATTDRRACFGGRGQEGPGAGRMLGRRVPVARARREGIRAHICRFMVHCGHRPKAELPLASGQYRGTDAIGAMGDGRQPPGP